MAVRFQASSPRRAGGGGDRGGVGSGAGTRDPRSPPAQVTDGETEAQENVEASTGRVSAPTGLQRCLPGLPMPRVCLP